MRLRVPPGRAGRLWLMHRLDVARRGQDVLDEKRQALLREEEGARARMLLAREEWEASAEEARRWLDRAAILGSERSIGLARLHAGGPARVEVAWRNTLGVLHPIEATLALPPARHADTLAGSAALVPCAEAHRRALEAGARYAVARTSHERVAAELERTVRRLQAIERRWLPEHRRALAGVELRLDEEEREETVRLRWASDRAAGR